MHHHRSLRVIDYLLKFRPVDVRYDTPNFFLVLYILTTDKTVQGALVRANKGMKTTIQRNDFQRITIYSDGIGSLCRDVRNKKISPRQPRHSSFA